MGRFPILKKQAIIAMKGLPYTYREETGKQIAAWSSSPIYQLEDSLDVLSREHGYDSDNPPSKEEATRLQRLAFDLVCQLAETQLKNYVRNNCVVISSPLFFTFHLDRLIKASISIDKPDNPCCRLLIIECRMKNKFQWQNYAELELKKLGHIDDQKKAREGGANGPTEQGSSINLDKGIQNLTDDPDRWYNPKSWKEVEKAIDDYGNEGWDDYYLKLRAPSHVRWLVLDPCDDIDPTVFTKTQRQQRRSLFAEAIKHFLTGEGEESVDRVPVDYHLWRRNQLERGTPADTPREASCGPGDCVFYYAGNIQHEKRSCGICEEQVNDQAYLCRFCRFCFHEACATEKRNAEIWYSDKDPGDMESRYGFPEPRACDKHEMCSYRCASCIFKSHLKCPLMPTIMKHVGHEHVLSVRLKWNRGIKRVYKCKACAGMGYVSSYCCNVCRADYHFACVYRPLEMEHEHGGHRHLVKIQFSCVKEEEYEWCLVCYKDIDPQTWVYTCQECDYVMHIYCEKQAKFGQLAPHLIQQ